MKNILICERFAVEALVRLKNNKNFLTESYSEEKLPAAHALIIRSKFKIDEDLLNRAKHLQLIVTCTSGFDHIDLKATEKKGICVMFTPDANSTSAAELTWALLLNANRKVTAAHKEMKAGQWNREGLLSHELAKKTLGIVGLGRIGSKVAKIACAFEMNVIAFDPYQEDEQFKKVNAKRASYEEVLKQSDFISFHVPATFETENMFSQSQLDYTSPELIVINTSRGQVINEEDLANALIDKKIKAAALDVFTKEPLNRNSKLLKAPNTVLTPHLGAYTEEAFLKASEDAAELTLNFFEKNQTRNTLPLKNDWGTLSFAERT